MTSAFGLVDYAGVLESQLLHGRIEVERVALDAPGSDSRVRAEGVERMCHLTTRGRLPSTVHGFDVVQQRRYGSQDRGDEAIGDRYTR
jgi:hypothetical protein